MAILGDRLSIELEEAAVIARAADEGFRLVRSETESGRTVWEWRHGDDPRPQFVTRGVAVHWMTEFLDRAAPVAYVSDAGEATTR